jgi:hypothetical protein
MKRAASLETYAGMKGDAALSDICPKPCGTDRLGTSDLKSIWLTFSTALGNMETHELFCDIFSICAQVSEQRDFEQHKPTNYLSLSLFHRIVSDFVRRR